MTTKEKLKKLLSDVLTYVLRLKNGVAVFYNQEDKIKIIKLIHKIKKEVEMQLWDNEAYQLYTAVSSTAKIKGDIAEVGVYKGGSARIICEAKKSKTLYLFDTFNGLPKPSETDNKKFKEGNCNTDIGYAKKVTRDYSNVIIFKGLFPETATPVENKRFSLVHFDVDLYKSIKDCLEFFYPRMNKGGIIISHDYKIAGGSGIKKALDEFFENKPEPIIELSGQQCLIVITQ